MDAPDRMLSISMCLMFTTAFRVVRATNSYCTCGAMARNLVKGALRKQLQSHEKFQVR